VGFFIEELLVFKIIYNENRFSGAILFLSMLFLFGGCAGVLVDALEKSQAEDNTKNAQTALAAGQRTFDLSKKKLMKAIVTAFANRNLPVMNLDKEIGFMVAEGAEFLDPAKVKEIGEKRIERLNKNAYPGAFRYQAGNYTLRITVNLFEKGEDKTLAKMGFTSVTQGTYTHKFDGVPHEFLPVYYEEMWAEIEKAIFVQRELVQ
jgi:hypothetical protein